MAVMPLVPKTKMADVGKLISLGNLLVRKVTWLVLTIMSATLILWRDFRVDYMTRIAYIYSHLSRNHSFHFDSQRQHALLHYDLQRQLTLSILTYRDNTHSLSLSFWLPALKPTKMYTFRDLFLSCPTFSVRLVTASNTNTKISSNHRKKPTINMGEDTFLLMYIIKFL